MTQENAKPVKAIYLPQDVLSTSDRRLIELKNQVQRLMEAHLAPNQPVQVNKIASLCEICNGSHDTQYCIKNSEQAFVEYASSRTDKMRGLVSNFIESQDARLSKFEADFKQQQGKMTKKIDAFLKAINDQMTGALPSDTVNNLKLNVNSTSLVLCARSYPTDDPQSSSCHLNSINVIKTCSKQTSNFQKEQLQMVIETGTPTPKEPEKPLEDEFKDLHLNLSILKVLAHAPMYNAILDNVESLELGKNRFAFIQCIMPEKMKDPKLFTLPYMETDPATPLLIGKGFLATANAIIDYKKAKIAVGEGVTRSIFGVKEIDLGEEEGNMWESEELIENRIDWNKPPKGGDGPWHAKIRLIDRDGKEFNKTFQSIPTTRKIWEALGGNTLDLDSIWEETGQDYNFTRSGFKEVCTVRGDDITIPSDAVRTYKRQRQELCDGFRT
nr:MAK10-like protein [Tanacetum cinerariifolium]